MEQNNYIHSELTGKIIRCAYDVFDELGFGFLESVYEKAFEKVLKEKGHHVVRQEKIPVFFRGELVGDFRADLIVDGLVIIELKASENLHPSHEAQILNYLRATKVEVGLLFNFGEKLTFKRKIFSNKNKKHLNQKNKSHSKS